ncbi:protein phosphatase CheZ [Govanella unica]|uniref:Protein phosphatase CheZ n=1 Tax=Govanella unica TaxID=2975056 RepID=A0A9X3TX23_9PROT|nr:protein phosphatase CheZ [Govania unica]MDA5193223.1 protein phosphatase CheZ [Govania unica]
MTAQPRHISLEARVEALVEQTGGQVDVSDIAGVVSGLMQSLRSDAPIFGHDLGQDVRDLISYVELAKAEIASLKPQTMCRRDIPEASEELDAIVSASEDAASRMMDVADEIQALAEDGNDHLVDRVADIATRIYEASSFQDITGQRVTKVVRVLNHLEIKLAALADAIGDTFVEERTQLEFAEDGEIVNETALLHGPQLPEVANNQDDIDALLASFD